MKQVFSWLPPLFLVAVTLLLWLPTVHLPYWWDSAGFVIQSSHQLLHTHFWPLTTPFSLFAHPPLFLFLLALCWNVFGESLVVSHLLTLLFTLLAVLSTYVLGRLLSKNLVFGTLIGFCSALLLLFTPVFLAQVGTIYIEIPLAALAILSYVWYLRKQYGCYALTASCMVLTKEVGVFVVLLFLILEIMPLFYRKKHGETRTLFPHLGFLLLPIGLLGAWFVYHRVMTGWWMVSPTLPAQGFTTLGFKLSHMSAVYHFLFFSQWRWVMLLCLVTTTGVSLLLPTQTWKTSVKHWPKERLPLVLLPLIYASFFGKTDYLYRYGILLLPFFYVATFYALSLVVAPLRKSVSVFLFAAITSTLLFLFATDWNQHRTYTSFVGAPIEDNLEYIDIIHIGQQLTHSIEQYEPKATVSTSFPVNYMLSQPFQGYVQKPIKTVECSDYKRGEKVDIIVLHLYAPSEKACLLLAAQLTFKHIQVFEENGKVMTILRP